MATRPEPRGKREEAIGAAFRAARTAAGVTLGEAARAAGTSINTIRWHEAGAVIMPPGPIFKAAAMFDANPEELGAAYRAQSERDDLAQSARAHGWRVVTRRATDELGLEPA